MYHYSTKRKETNQRKKILILALLSSIPFVLIVLLTLSGWNQLTVYDYQISNLFYNLHNPTLTKVMTAITHLGDMVTQTLVTLGIVSLLFILKKWRSSLWYGLTVLIGALFLNASVKEFYARARPSQIDPLVEIGGYSFPSGHSMGAVIVYGGLLFLIFRFIRSDVLKWALSLFIITMILAIGLSRIYLGVHFPSDVIGGFSLGLTWLLLSIALSGFKITRLETRSRNKYTLKKI